MKLELFDKEKTNTGRQLEMDIARGLAVIFMVLVHVQMTFSNTDSQESTIGQAVDFFGGIPAAPVFMFLMGVGFVYTRKTDPVQFAKRGRLIFLAGYILNFLRDSLPGFVNYWRDGDSETLSAAIENFFTVDILQFAGITIGLFGFIKWANLNTLSVAAIGLAFSLIHLPLLLVEIDNLFLAAITGLVWGSNDNSEFPFLTWQAYPIFGYIFGTFLIRCNSKSFFYFLLGLLSTIGLFASVFLFRNLMNLELGMSSELDYYHHTIFANIVYLFFTLAWIGLLFGFSLITPGFVNHQFKRWSKNVTEIYFIHWVLIGWINWGFGEQKFGFVVFLLLSVSIFLLSDFAAHWMDKKKLKFL